LDKFPVYWNGSTEDLKRAIDQVTLSAGRVEGGLVAPGLSAYFKNQLVSCSTEELEGEPERIIITVGDFTFCADNETFNFFACEQEERGVLIISKDQKTTLRIEEIIE